jgi:hypothetical protein
MFCKKDEPEHKKDLQEENHILFNEFEEPNLKVQQIMTNLGLD